MINVTTRARRATRLGLALAALLAVIGLSSCAKKAPEKKALIRPVRTLEVTSGSTEERRRFSGVAQAGEESRLSFLVAGTVRQISVKVGDRVKQGDPIASLDPTDYELQVQEAQAGLAQAQAQERNAEASYARVRALYENQNASRQELDAARAAAETSTMQVRSIQQRLQLARRQLKYATLTAPAAGAIAVVHVEANENVSAGQPIVSLQSEGEVKVNLSLPESLIRRVERDQAARVTISALGGKTFSGKVFEVGVSSERSATFPVTVRLDDAGSEVLPGMACDVSIEFAAVTDASTGHRVPSVAVGEDREGRFVFVVEPDEQAAGFATVHRRAVEVGELSDSGLEVREGLSEGDTIVTAGVNQLRDGLRVRLLTQAAE